MGKEKLFENKIKKWLQDHNCYHVKFFANAYTKKGVPDILACVNGYWVAIEVKAPEGVVSELQLHNIRKIRESGGLAYIVYPSGWEKLEQILTGLLNETFNREESEVLK